MGPIIQAALQALPGIIAGISDMVKKPDPLQTFNTTIKDAERAARTEQEKARVEELRIQGLKYLRDWYASQDPNSPPPTVAKWGQSGVDNYKRNIEMARAELAGQTTAFSTGSAPNTFGYTGSVSSPQSTNIAYGQFMANLMDGPKSWDWKQWSLVGALLFFFTPLKKILK